MAYNIDNRYYLGNSAPVTTYPCTFSAISVPSESAGIYEHSLVAVAKSNFYDSFSLSCVRSTANYAELGVRVSNSGTFVDTSATSTSVPGTWAHACGAFASSTLRTLYYNATGAVTSTTNKTPTGINTLGIGFRYPISNLGRGYIAEVAIWNVVLTVEEIASLAKGFKPTRIRPQSLVFYAPLVRNVADLRGGMTLTPSASPPTVSNHPRVY